MVTVTIQTTAKQDARLAALLAEINAARQAQGQAPFADVNALCTDTLRNQLLSWVRAMQSREDEAVRNAYGSATEAVQAQVRTLLGVP